jgi:predicted secreted protein
METHYKGKLIKDVLFSVKINDIEVPISDNTLSEISDIIFESVVDEYQKEDSKK